MSYNQLTTALSDIYGYSVNNFNGRGFSEIWEELDDQERHAVREYTLVDELCA